MSKNLLIQFSNQVRDKSQYPNCIIGNIWNYFNDMKRYLRKLFVRKDDIFVQDVIFSLIIFYQQTSYHPHSNSLHTFLDFLQT